MTSSMSTKRSPAELTARHFNSISAQSASALSAELRNRMKMLLE